MLAPLFHGNAPEPTPGIRCLFLHFRRRERRFLSPSVLSTVARPRPSSAVLLAERDDLYRDRMRRAARSVLVPVSSISVISFNNMNLCPSLWGDIAIVAPWVELLYYHKIRVHTYICFLKKNRAGRRGYIFLCIKCTDI